MSNSTIPQENRCYICREIDPYRKVFPVEIKLDSPTSEVSSSVITVTPEMAEKWLKEYRYHYQRPIRKSDLKQICTMMENEEWEPGTQIKFGVGPTLPNPILIDGYHRLTAQVQNKTDQVYDVVIVRCRDDAHLANIYNKTDIGAPRTRFHSMITMGVKDELGLLDWQLRAAMVGVTLFSGNFIQSQSPFIGRAKDELLAKEILKYRDGIEGYFTLPQPKTKEMFRIVRKASVSALGILTFQYAVKVYGIKKVENFWDGVIFANGFFEGDPRKLAHMHMTTHSIRGRKSDKEPTSVEYQSRYLIHCWNAYTEDRKLTGTSVHDTSSIVKIKGTPWK